MPPAHPERHHNTTSRKPTRNNTKGNDLNKPPHNPRLDTHQPLPCRAPAAVPTHRTPASSRVYGRGRGPSGHEPDYSRKFMPKSMAPSASRKSSDTEPSPKSASE